MIFGLQKQILTLPGLRGDIMDDWFGLDPNGGGLHALTRDLMSVIDPLIAPIADDWLGMDPNGGGMTDIANTVIPMVAAYFTGGALAGSIGTGTTGAAAGEAAFAAADAASLAASGLSEAAIAQNLVYSGVASTTAAELATMAAAGYDTLTMTAILSDAATSLGQSIYTSGDFLASAANNPTLLNSIADTFNIDPSTLQSFADQIGESTFNTPDWLSESGMDIGNINNSLSDMVARGELTGDQAMQAMQAYNNAASGGEWGQFLSSAGVDDWATSSGWSLKDVFNSGSLLNNIKSLGNIAGGIYGTIAQGELADKQNDLAKWLVQNADPYREFRKWQEIPFMGEMLDRAPGLMDTAEQTGQAAYNTLTDPYYQNKLRQSYDDPLAAYNSPEMKALSDVFMGGIERRDAAAGRNSQYGARAVEAQNNFLTNALPQYRTGLQAGQAGLTQQGSALGNLFNQQGNYATQIADLGKPGGKAGAGASGAADLMSNANAMDAFQYGSLFKALGSLGG